jgi:hypothetical protein
MPAAMDSITIDGIVSVPFHLESIIAPTDIGADCDAPFSPIPHAGCNHAGY